MLLFLNDKLKDEFADDKLNVLLRGIQLLAAEYCDRNFKKPLYVTSIYRDGDTGVHGAWRGIDSDNDNLNKAQKKKMAAYINKYFTYDPMRPDMVVCLLHSVKGRGGDHFHMQVHERTFFNYEFD